MNSIYECKKICKSVFFFFKKIEYYEVVADCGVLVRRGKDRTTKKLKKLPKGTILISEIKLHDRLRIKYPIIGWISWRDKNEYSFVQRLENDVNLFLFCFFSHIFLNSHPHTKIWQTQHTLVLFFLPNTIT